MRLSAAVGLTALCGVLAATACEDAGDTRVLGIRASGVVLGLAYFDVNGNRTFDVADLRYPDLGVRLVARGTRDTVARATSNVEGAYAMFDVTIGDYNVIVDTSNLGDTIRVIGVDKPVLHLGPNDSVLVRVGVGFPIVPVADARALPTGRRVFVEGVALNPPALFGDTTVHFADVTGAIRATRVRGTPVSYGAGDSLRLLGRRANRSGQPTLDDVTVFVLGSALGGGAQDVTTAAAASAQAGALDARLVRVLNATISASSTTTAGDIELTVNDGSGVLVVVLDANAALNATGLTPPNVIDVIGVLVPTGNGDFRLKPRFNTDIVRH